MSVHPENPDFFSSLEAEVQRRESQITDAQRRLEQLNTDKENENRQRAIREEARQKEVHELELAYPLLAERFKLLSYLDYCRFKYFPTTDPVIFSKGSETYGVEFNFDGASSTSVSVGSYYGYFFNVEVPTYTATVYLGFLGTRVSSPNKLVGIFEEKDSAKGYATFEKTNEQKAPFISGLMGATRLEPSATIASGDTLIKQNGIFQKVKTHVHSYFAVPLDGQVPLLQMSREIMNGSRQDLGQQIDTSIQGLLRVSIPQIYQEVNSRKRK